ncbi:FAD-dependent oxidoreductase [Actinopolymorpha pittospori]|uniref:Pyruvate/2-oxoglutarate dehydrogenase complex dihydrolipoamide dehydrogenase (E3) component n=1 Tax=Actinopolymorpha pittospori TaxID=648752 RepID=A0A927MXR8_9ACTN|nr:pyruvate/2-oxoglutarate dehydrogenase complex dihydrolipoamide dehydrogenase (E3) component [Actinopolymorpha pittospori]
MVLGGGPGGLTAATTAAAGGHRVAMTEQRLTGGTCVNFGCTPSKALIRCARAVHDANRGDEFGFRLDAPPQTDFGSVMDRVRKMRSLSSAHDAVEMAEQAGVEVYLGHTRFTAPNAVEVDGRVLRFRKAVIATGSVPVVPPIEGLQTGDYLTNETVFSLTQLPARLVVIGSGPLGCELAQAFHRLGAEVDMVSRPSTLLANDEPEVGELIRRRFEQEGIGLHLGFEAVRADGGRLLVQGPDGTRELPYDALLLGTGRKANVEHLNLDAAGVHLDRDGVEVDDYLCTSNADIYAAGDATFPQKFTHAANATALLGIANALDEAHRPARELVIPHCTYTDPEVAEVGLTPRRARDEGVAIDAYRLDLTQVERAFIDGEEEGFGAIYRRSDDDEIAGATLVAAHAGEMISELTLAITNHMPLEALAGTVHCYPTQAEVFQRIALQHAQPQRVAVPHPR